MSRQSKLKLPMPSGWFRIATSQELPTAKVGVFQINGQDVVAFRNEQGAVAVVDPICPHMGVHVGHNGAAPTWELPEYDTTGWTEPVTKVLTLKGHVQDVAENAVDFGHFAAVHEYSASTTASCSPPRRSTKRQCPSASV